MVVLDFLYKKARNFLFSFKKKMFSSSLLSLILLKVTIVASESKFQDYNGYAGFTVNNSTTNRISSFNRSSKATCLATCNLVSACLTAVYTGNSCLLFNKIFCTNEKLMTSSSSFLFEKKSECIFLKDLKQFL